MCCWACLTVLETQRRWQGLVFTVTIFAAGWGLQSVDWTHAHGQPLSVRLAQGNIDQGENSASNSLTIPFAVVREDDDRTTRGHHRGA